MGRFGVDDTVNRPRRLRFPPALPALPRGAGTRRLLLATLLAGLVGGGSAAAYRFYGNGQTSIPSWDGTPGRFHPGAWGPGETLVWHVADDPEWSLGFRSPEQVVPVVARALAEWSRIATADIEWRVEGLAEDIGNEGYGKLDGKNMVFVDPPYGGAYGRQWHQWDSRYGWRAVECDVGIGDWFVEALGNGEYFDILVHEIGHCLGLAHAATTPAVGQLWRRDSGFVFRNSAVWDDGSIMSGGGSIGPALLSEDDEIGASLLRPARGWLRTTGRVSGTLRLNGAPVAYAIVALLRNEDGMARGAFSVFSDEAGDFLLEGVRPGEYYLHVYPLLSYGAHPGLLEGLAPLFDDAFLPRPIRVAAGGESGGHVVNLRRGRDP